MVPRENKNNAYVKFGGTNKEYYGIFRNGLQFIYYSCAAKRVRCKMPSVSCCFWRRVSAWKFMLAYIYIHDCNFTWGGGRRLFKQFNSCCVTKINRKT